MAYGLRGGGGGAWRRSCPGGTSIGAATLLLLKRKKYDKSSEMRATIFNQISAAALIKFYDFLMRCLFERGAY